MLLPSKWQGGAFQLRRPQPRPQRRHLRGIRGVELARTGAPFLLFAAHHRQKHNQKIAGHDEREDRLGTGQRESRQNQR
jgi:hypothetical protein